jgi:acetolactate synthase-1/2/3 large subunit
MTRLVADAIADYLIRAEIDHVFVGPPTNHQFCFFEALNRRRNEILPILVRHEAVAVTAADGWFKATRRPAVFHLGTGPSLANAVTGLMSSFTGQVGSIGIVNTIHTRFRGRGALQEVIGVTDADGISIVQPIVKHLFRIVDPAQVTEVLNRAFAAATSGLPGPVVIDVPMDVMSKEAESEPDPVDISKYRPQGSPMPDPGAVDQTMNLLTKAERPVILAGGGATTGDSVSSLVALVERTKTPLVTTYTGKGSIPEDHPLCFGVVGVSGSRDAMTLVSEADLILALGVSFHERTTSSWTPGLPFNIPPSRLVQVDLNPEHIGRYYPVDVGIVADVENTVGEFAKLIDGRSLRNDEQRQRWIEHASNLRDQWKQEQEPYVSSRQDPIRPETVISTLRRVSPRGTTLLPDAGNNGNWCHAVWEAYSPRTYIIDSGMAAMGYAVSASLGVKMAHPEDQVIVVTGDGCLTQANWALSTAVEYDIPVKFVVLNDRALGGCVSVQESLFGEDGVDTRFGDHGTGERQKQDFVKLAKSYDMDAERVEHIKGMDAACQRLVEAESPRLLEVLIDPDARVRGVGRMVILE